MNDFKHTKHYTQKVDNPSLILYLKDNNWKFILPQDDILYTIQNYYCYKECMVFVMYNDEFYLLDLISPYEDLFELNVYLWDCNDDAYIFLLVEEDDEFYGMIRNIYFM